MSKPYMRWFWGDWFANTKHLTHAEKGAYLDLIGHYWEHGSLPNDDKRLALILAMDVRTFRTKYREILRAFFAADWKHKKIDHELARYRERSMQSTLAGRLGGLQKVANAKANALANASQKPSERSTNARLRLQDKNINLLAQNSEPTIPVDNVDNSKKKEKKPVAETVAQMPHSAPPQSPTNPKETSMGFDEHAARQKANGLDPLRIRTPDECQPSEQLAKTVLAQTRERAALPPDPKKKLPPVSDELSTIVARWRDQGLVD